MRSVAALFVLLALAAPCWANSTDAAADLAYDEIVEEPGLKEAVLSSVRAHISEASKEDGLWTVKDPVSGEEQQFEVIEIFDRISRKGDIYTVQVDADKVGAKPGEVFHLLLVDAVKEGNAFKVSGIRKGSKHLKQISEPSLPPRS